MNLTPSPEKLGVRVTYLQGTRRFALSKDFFTVDQIVLEIERRFENTVFERRQFDFGDGLVLENIPGREEIHRIIGSAMQNAGIQGDRLSPENRGQIELFFNQYLPKGKKRVIRETIEGAVKGISTAQLQQSSTRSGNLAHDASVFLTEDFETELSDQNRFVVNEMRNRPVQIQLIDVHPDHIRHFDPAIHLYAVNTSLFRTHQDLVILSHEPERQFLIRLVEHSRQICAWIKSPDRDFYSLEYEYWKRGKDRVRRSFNPDFFIRIRIRDFLLTSPGLDPSAVARLRNFQENLIDDLILVVEIKSDEDDSDTTSAKAASAKEHFQSLNQRLGEINPNDLPEEFRQSNNQRYLFYLLRPEDYPGWFAKLRTGMLVHDLKVG